MVQPVNSKRNLCQPVLDFVVGGVALRQVPPHQCSAFVSLSCSTKHSSHAVCCFKYSKGQNEIRILTDKYRVSRGNVPDFGRMFLTLKYTDMTQNTYIYPKLNGYGDNGERSLKV